jgi:hypothetical protein
MRDWTSKNYTKEQCTFIYAICCKILEKWDKAVELFDLLKGQIKSKMNKKFVNQTVQLMLLPLEKNKFVVED